MRVRLWLIIAISLLVSGPETASGQDATRPRQEELRSSDRVFLVEPYLQWGDVATWGRAPGLVVLWQTDDQTLDGTVEFRPGADQPWRKAEVPTTRRIALPGILPHRLYRAAVKTLKNRPFAERKATLSSDRGQSAT
jgi:hypothetical protein